MENGAAGLVVWFTGLSSSGKTTLSTVICNRLAGAGYRAEHLDGDCMRRHIGKELGFSREDRQENLRRICFVAELLKRHGVIVLVAAISPYRGVRDEIRKKIGDRFVEVFVKAPLDVCEKRDVKGLYKKARAGLIADFTGLDAPYEEPYGAEVECRTDIETIEQSAEKVFQFLLPLLRHAHAV